MLENCPCGDTRCAIYDGNAYPGQVIHCRMLSSNEKGKAVTVWTGTGYLYDIETDLGFAPGVTLPEDFPWTCESQKVKVTLEVIDD